MASTISSACSSEPAHPPDTLSREAFIATYTDLRLAVLNSSDREIPSARRDSILGVHGITEAELLQFPQVHGRDVVFMDSVWSEIEDRVQDGRAAFLQLTR